MRGGSEREGVLGRGKHRAGEGSEGRDVRKGGGKRNDG